MRRILIPAALVLASPVYAQATYSPGVTQADIAAVSTIANNAQTAASVAQAAAASSVKTVNATAPDAGGNVALVLPSNFIPGFTSTSPGTVASLLSGSPCNASRIANYAVVSDLYSGAASTNEVMRCSSSGSAYYWRPQRTDYVAAAAVSGGTISLACLQNAPTMFVSGALVSNLTLALQTTNCWPGAQFSIANGATLGIFGVTLSGLIGSTTASLGLNGRITVYFDGTAWRIF